MEINDIRVPGAAVLGQPAHIDLKCSSDPLTAPPTRPRLTQNIVLTPIVELTMTFPPQNRSMFSNPVMFTIQGKLIFLCMFSLTSEKTKKCFNINKLILHEVS